MLPPMTRNLPGACSSVRTELRALLARSTSHLRVYKVYLYYTYINSTEKRMLLARATKPWDSNTGTLILDAMILPFCISYNN